MGLADDLNSEVIQILSERWSRRQRRGVPESEDLELSNDA